MMKMAKRTGLLFLVLAAILCGSFGVLADTAGGADTYIYSSNGTGVASPDAYVHLSSVAITDNDDVPAGAPTDMFVAKDGRVYILDGERNLVFIYDENLQRIGVIDQLYTLDGNFEGFNSPEGIFVADNGDIYVADTGNERILVFGQDGIVIRSITKPEGIRVLSKDEKFLPSKLAVDAVGRIYVIAKNVNMGIIQLASEGVFMSYIGAPTVKTDLLDLFWRRFSTEAQLAQMQEYIPTEYNNIYLDDHGFLYGTISSISAEEIENIVLTKDTSGSITPIRKLNSMGTDILSRNGFYPPIGDLVYASDDTISKIVDVADNGSGVYSLLDYTRGRIFTYNDDGQLLFAFGRKGNKKGQSQYPVAIGYLGERILLLDQDLAEILVYEPTAYGELVLGAVAAQKEGRYEEAYESWSRVAEQNSNFQYAFIGLGKAYVSQGEYEKAMECFAYAQDKENYSDAKEQLRKQDTKVIFPVVFLGILLLVVLAVVASLVRRFVRYTRRCRR